MLTEHPLAKARNAIGLSQAALAAKVGCKRWMINRIEAGERAPSMQLLGKISAETGVSADDVLEWISKRRAA